MHMTCNLREFKEFIDNEMIVILGQMDSPTEIFDHVFLVRLIVSHVCRCYDAQCMEMNRLWNYSTMTKEKMFLIV